MDILDLCVVALYFEVTIIPSFSMGATLGVKYDVILVLRSQIFEYLRETFYRHALEYLEPARSEKKKKEKKIFLRKHLTIADLFEGLWSVGTRFRR